MSKRTGRRIRTLAAAVLAAALLAPCTGYAAETGQGGMGEPSALSEAEPKITVESEKDEVPTFKAGEAKEWTFVVKNVSSETIEDIVIAPELGDTSDVWPFKTDYQHYRKRIDKLGVGESVNVKFNFTQRDDVPTTRYTLQFAISAGGKDMGKTRFYVNTTAKPQENTNDTDNGGQGGAAYISDGGGVSNGDAVYSGGSSGVGSGSGDEAGASSVPRVIVTGFSTDPAEVRAGSNFRLTIHLRNTSKSTGVRNMLFDMSAPTEGSDEQTMAPAFLPVSGSSSVYLDGIRAGGTADIAIDLNAKADLLQKPYSIDIAMKYEDKNGAQIDAASSLSVPVKQDPRFELSEFEISPEEIAVGEEANVMCSLYNLGRIKLYNVKAIFEGACIEKEELYLGNVEPGASASIDAMLEGKTETKGPGKVTLTLSYEDESGQVSQYKEELKLTVTAGAEDEDTVMADMEGMEGEQGGFPVIPAVIGGAAVIAAAVAAVVIRRKKKARKQSEEEEWLNELDGSSEDEL